MSFNSRLHSQNLQLEIFNQKKSNHYKKFKHIETSIRKYLESQSSQKDLSFLNTTKISLGNYPKKQGLKFSRISQSSFSKTSKQANPRIQRLKQQAKYLDQSNFDSPYLTISNEFPHKEKKLVSQQFDFIHKKGFTPAKKKFLNYHKLKQPLKTKGKRTVSTLINSSKFEQLQTVQNFTSKSFEMKPYQTIEYIPIKPVKKQTPLIVKKYYQVYSQRRELNKLKYSRYDILSQSQNLKNNKFQEKVEGVRASEVYRKNKKYEEYFIISL